ncbi:hypothetical protein KC320_g7110 [Hortaea werneckii]|nr:hypothetical protein KC320_g7110 [Hortaea werneckii]
MASLDRTITASTPERYDLAVAESHNGEQTSSVLELKARNGVEPNHLPAGWLTQDLSPNSSHKRPEVSGAGFSTKCASSPSNEASPGPAQPSKGSTRSIGIISNECRQPLKAAESSTSKQLARYPQRDHNEHAQKLISPSLFAQHSHLHRTDILQGLFPSKTTWAVAQGMEGDALEEKMLDDSVLDTADASDVTGTTFVTGELTVRHPSLHGFQLPPPFPPRRRGFDPGELEGAMAAAFGWA